MTCNKPVRPDPCVRPSNWADTWVGPYECFISKKNRYNDPKLGQAQIVFISVGEIYWKLRVLGPCRPFLRLRHNPKK